MPTDKVITLHARGLATAQSTLKDGAGAGRLQRADDAVISKEGLWEPRRGVARVSTVSGTDLDLVAPYVGQLALHDASTGTFYLYDPITGLSQSLVGSYSKPLYIST